MHSLVNLCISSCRNVSPGFSCYGFFVCFFVFISSWVEFPLILPLRAGSDVKGQGVCLAVHFCGHRVSFYEQTLASLDALLWQQALKALQSKFLCTESASEVMIIHLLYLFPLKIILTDKECCFFPFLHLECHVLRCSVKQQGS